MSDATPNLDEDTKNNMDALRTFSSPIKSPSNGKYFNWLGCMWWSRTHEIPRGNADVNQSPLLFARDWESRYSVGRYVTGTETHGKTDVCKVNSLHENIKSVSPRQVFRSGPWNSIRTTTGISHIPKVSVWIHPDYVHCRGYSCKKCNAIPSSTLNKAAVKPDTNAVFPPSSQTNCTPILTLHNRKC